MPGSTTTYRRNVRKESVSRKVKNVSSTVVYRNGSEQREAKVERLTTSGEFGSTLSTAMLEAAKGRLSRRRWQAGPSSPSAVLRYVVTAEQSHYEVDGRATGYVDEITIDPSSGAIERLVLLADMPTDGELVTADIAVEYGPIELAAKPIPALRAIALSHGFELIWLKELTQRLSLVQLANEDPIRTAAQRLVALILTHAGVTRVNIMRTK